MYILWIFLCWIGMCQAKYIPGEKVACLDKHAWRMPDWDLPTNDFIEKFTESNRPWRHPLIQGLVDNQNLPADVVLPEPLLPTNDSSLLKLYDTAIRLLAHDDAASDKDKQLAEDRFDQDRACRAYEVECQTASWMISWPFWSCERPKKTGAFAQAQRGRELDNLTLSLLKRANRYALLNLARRLVLIVKKLPAQPPYGNSSFPLHRRVYNEQDEPLPHIGIPKFALHVESLVRFYTNPKHRAEHEDVRQPHLPNHFVPPSPLLSTLNKEVNRSDSNIKLAKLYKDALKAYDEDSKLSDKELRRRRNQNLDDSWDWIVADPCYYDRTACNIYDTLNRIFSSGFFKGHEEQGKALKKTMEHVGLARLGSHLMLENTKNKGTRQILDHLLNMY